jgi:hypothetical protein
MRQNLKNIFFISAILLLFTSCEYELSGEFNRDIAKPVPTHPFSLDLNPKTDTVYIVGNMSLNYNFNNDNLNIINIKFELNGKTINDNITAHSGTIQINGKDLTTGEYKLKATLITHSGTNSIADGLGAEGYIATKEWTVIVDHPYITDIPKPVFSKTADGFLKISWEKCNVRSFQYYSLGTPSNRKFKIYDRNTTSFVDSLYIPNGMQMADISFTYYSEYGMLGTNQAVTTIAESLPDIKFEKKGVDSVRIYWKRATYNVRYELFTDNHYAYKPTVPLFKNYTDSSVIVEQSGFEWINYKLKISSFIQPPGETVLTRTGNSAVFYQGRSFNYGLNELAYNFMDKILYLSANTSTYRHNIEKMSYDKYIVCNLGTYKNSCPTNSGKVAIITPTDISIYSDKELSTKVSMSFQRKPDYFILCDNDIVVMSSSTNGLEYVNVAENRILSSKLLDSYSSANTWSCTSTTIDARYSCVVSTTGVSVFEFANSQLTTKYTDTHAYRSCLFDKTNPYLIVLTSSGSSELEIRNITDFSLVKTIQMIANNIVLCNIDPETGYLLATDFTRVYFINIQTGKTVYSMRCTNKKPRLFKGKLISNDGNYIDINSKLHD